MKLRAVLHYAASSGALSVMKDALPCHPPKYSGPGRPSVQARRMGALRVSSGSRCTSALTAANRYGFAITVMAASTKVLDVSPATRNCTAAEKTEANQRLQAIANDSVVQQSIFKILEVIF